MSPTQAIVIPVSPKYEEYAIKVSIVCFIRGWAWNLILFAPAASLRKFTLFLSYVFRLRKTWNATTRHARPDASLACERSRSRSF